MNLFGTCVKSFLQGFSLDNPARSVLEPPEVSAPTGWLPITHAKTVLRLIVPRVKQAWVEGEKRGLSCLTHHTGLLRG